VLALIAFDAASLAIIDELLAEDRLPHLRALRASGTEYPLERVCTRVGRGPGVELSFADQAMSRQHAAFELGADGFRLRDLGSTNGCLVNGAKVDASDLKHADRIQIGEHEFQLVVAERPHQPRAHPLRDE